MSKEFEPNMKISHHAKVWLEQNIALYNCVFEFLKTALLFYEGEISNKEFEDLKVEITEKVPFSLKDRFYLELELKVPLLRRKIELSKKVNATQT